MSKQTGRTVAYYMREAITTHLDDLEDVYLPEQVLGKLRCGKDRRLNSEDFRYELEN